MDAGGTVGTLASAAPVGFPLAAPPGTITVSSGALKATAPVTITGGPGSPTGTTAPPAGPVVGPVCDPSPFDLRSRTTITAGTKLIIVSNTGGKLVITA